MLWSLLLLPLCLAQQWVTGPNGQQQYRQVPHPLFLLKINHFRVIGSGIRHSSDGKQRRRRNNNSNRWETETFSEINSRSPPGQLLLRMSMEDNSASNRCNFPLFYSIPILVMAFRDRETPIRSCEPAAVR